MQKIFFWVGIIVFTASCGFKLPKQSAASSPLGISLAAARTITIAERDLLYNICNALRAKRNQLIFEPSNSMFFLLLTEKKCFEAPIVNEISAGIRTSGTAPQQILLWSSTYTGKFYSEFITDTSSELGQICPKILEGDFIQNTFDWEDQTVGLEVAHLDSNRSLVTFFYTKKVDTQKKIFRWQKISVDLNQSHATLGMAVEQSEERQCEGAGEGQSTYYFEQRLR